MSLIRLARRQIGHTIRGRTKQTRDGNHHNEQTSDALSYTTHTILSKHYRAGVPLSGKLKKNHARVLPVRRAGKQEIIGPVNRQRNHER